ncbi:hypothetical protein C464_16032 [Halorubrum coriense DSM 10284]|uniref:Uncharacterized protein n=1 Tax=Halorubrum coriense DSM 10284 TaxID=1227466 RepID=M0E789_9EURY|nr:hypothetical protein C464_16032 [Halorubrum coriense DSM 10284]
MWLSRELVNSLGERNLPLSGFVTRLEFQNQYLTLLSRHLRLQVSQPPKRSQSSEYCTGQVSLISMLLPGNRRTFLLSLGIKPRMILHKRLRKS